MKDLTLLDRMFFRTPRPISPALTLPPASGSLTFMSPASAPGWLNLHLPAAMEQQSPHERLLILPFTGTFDVSLPQGFRFIEGRMAPAFYLSNIHAFAFQTWLSPMPRTGEQAFTELRRMLAIALSWNWWSWTRSNRPVSASSVSSDLPFCELEPLAVVWWHRRSGLAKALLHEGANRVMALGPCRGMRGRPSAIL